MKIIDKIIHKLILLKGFSYYKEDKYLIKEIIKFSEKKNPKVLDVGCGTGHYSFLFEKYGASVIAFDYNKLLIEKIRNRKIRNDSKIEFTIIDGNYPERYFNKEFNVIFMSGFSLFALNLDEELMKKYLVLLNDGGKLIFVWNSNLTGLVRRTHWKNYTIEELRYFFENLDSNIEKFYFYDRHIIGKLFRSSIFSNFSTKIHLFITRITKLPCNIVLFVSGGLPASYFGFAEDIIDEKWQDGPIIVYDVSASYFGFAEDIIDEKWQDE